MGRKSRFIMIKDKFKTLWNITDETFVRKKVNS